MTGNDFRRFAADRRGNVALMFTFAIIPLLILIGAAVDFGQATRVRAQLQNATDVAALSVARDGLSQPDSALEAIARRYLDANYTLPEKDYGYSLDHLKFDRPTVTAEVDTTVLVPTTFLRLMGMTTIPVHAHSITKGLGVEVALVLDTSGSMTESAGAGGSKITALKDATKALLKVFYGDATVSQRFSIGIIPFAASVNVGSGYKTASWMDTANVPANGDHTEDFTAPNAQQANRFSLFKGGNQGLANVSWKGCVMARPAPYDINDAAPSGGSTLFVPWFAPDEPDAADGEWDESTDTGENVGWVNSKWTDYRDGSFFFNDYLDDEGGVCPTDDQKKVVPNSTKQGRTCKYKGAWADTSATYLSNKGPNFLCDSQPITPLTSTRSTLENAVTALNAQGTTNITEGFMWGWRTLSNNEPFTQGKAYNAPNNKKIIILMTDGVNNFGGRAQPKTTNLSEFFAYGYALRGNSGAPKTSNNSTLTDFLDDKTEAACAAAKAKGIIIYTIAFGSGANQSHDLLMTCASEPVAPYFNAPQSSADLKPVFVKIAESINALRIAQ